jgi:hypothetical protein
MKYTLGFMLLQNGNVRVRVYDSANNNTFIYQWEVLAADWISILTDAGAAAIHAGNVDVENVVANYGKQAGQVGVLEAVS